LVYSNRENEGLSLDINLGTFGLDVGELKSSGCEIFADFLFPAIQQTFDNHDNSLELFALTCRYLLFHTGCYSYYDTPRPSFSFPRNLLVSYYQSTSLVWRYFVTNGAGDHDAVD
jgi:hypothetical protein